MTLPEPFCEFCRNKDGSFNYDEWHALLLGFATPYFMWPFIVGWSQNAAYLAAKETWYVAGGMLLHWLTILLPSVILLVEVVAWN